MTGLRFPVNRWYVGNQTSVVSQFLGVSRKGNLWSGQVVIGVIKSSWSQKWEGSNASGHQPHSMWLHRNVKLLLSLAQACANAMMRRRKKKQQSHPEDGLYRAVTAALVLQQIRRLCQDKRSCGKLLAPTQKSHSNSRTQMYAGCLLKGCQNSSRSNERHLACIRSLSSSQWAWCPQKMGKVGKQNSSHIRNWDRLEMEKVTWK